MTQSTQDMLYDHVRSSARLLDEVWEAIDGKECESATVKGTTLTTKSVKHAMARVRLTPMRAATRRNT
jgi:hypothetical protein